MSRFRSADLPPMNNVYDINYTNDLTELAKKHFGKGNSKVKQDFQKYLGAVRMSCNNDAEIDTPFDAPIRAEGWINHTHSRPFKKLTCSSFDRR